MSARRLAGAVLLAAALAAAPGAARAGGVTAEERSEGRRRFEKAEQHYQRGEYAEALEEYEAGYRVTRLPGFLVNIAQCHRMMGDLRKARAHYRKFLLIVPTSPRRGEVEEVILTLDRAIAAEGEREAAAAARAPRTPSPRWWIWSALAASVVGSTVATSALAAAEERDAARR